MDVYRRMLQMAMLSIKKELRNGVIPEKRIIDGIEIAPYKGNAKAAVSISADFEMSWAWRGRLSSIETEEMGRRERDNVPLILQILNEFKVPITWATVGHLFLDSCERGKCGRAHAEMHRPLKNDLWNGDWYVHDPCTNYKMNPNWYCPDLIQQIIESDVRHEIGTHSFSHINCLPDYASEALIRNEIEKCRAAMDRFGIKPRSMAYPNNKMGYLDVLSREGIIGVRKRDPKVLLSFPVRSDEGTYQVIETLSLGKPRFCRFIDKTRILLDLAIKRNAVFCVWFHPSVSREILINEFREMVKEMSSKREQGLIWIATIEELVSYCEARDKTKLRVMKDACEMTIYVESSMENERYGSAELTILVPVTDKPRRVVIENGASTDDIRYETKVLKDGKMLVMMNIPIEATALRLLF